MNHQPKQGNGYVRRMLVVAIGLIGFVRGAGSLVAEAAETDATGRQWVEADSKALGDGFIDHGPFGVVVGGRGYVSTTNGQGQDVVLSWLWESGSYSGWLAMINVDTGEYQEFKQPDVTGPYSSLLSTDNKLYALYNYFVEFDPTKPGYTFAEHVQPDDREHNLRAMSWAEGHDGRIWAVSHPNATVVSFDPETKQFQNHGSVFDHESQTFPLTMAVDDAGWVYVAISSQGVGVMALNPETGETQRVPDKTFTFNSHRGIRVHQAKNGKAYASVRSNGRSFELYEGRARELESEPAMFNGFDFNERTYIIDGRQGVTGYFRLAHGELPSSRRVATFDVKRVDPYMIVKDPDGGETKRIAFDPSGGATQPMGLTNAPDGTIVGGTYIPHQFFNYDPPTDRWFRTADFTGQLNTMTSTDKYVYFGVYASGALYEWDPRETWNPPLARDRPQNLQRNPKWLATAYLASTGSGSEVGRPYTLLAHPNGRHVIMGGNRGYGEGFGGLLFWDRQTQQSQVLWHKDVIPNQNTFCLVALPNGNILGGTTTEPAQGGVRKADTAVLYEMNPNTKEVLWQVAPYDDLTSDREYWDLMRAGDLVYGVTYPRASNRFFVFDPQSREVIYDKNLDRRTPHQQGPVVFHKAPDGRVFILFENGDIAQIDGETFEIQDRASMPTDGIIRNGGVVHDGRLYFCTNERLISWQIPETNSGE